MPINIKIKGFFIRYSLLLKKYRINYIFKCKRIGIVWSSAGFPDVLTRHMMFEGMYQEDVLVALRHIIKLGDTVFDVGGHHGLMAIISSFAAGPQGRVITFEPNPHAREYLKQHISINGISNVEVQPVALTDKDGIMPFFVQSGDVTWNSSIIKDFASSDENAGSIMIKAMTLDGFTNNTGYIPKVIKIDVEGAEFLVLRGALETIRKHRPAVIMEFNPASAAAAKTSINDIVECFKELSYKLLVLEPSFFGYYAFNRQVVFDENRHSYGEKLCNVICLPS